MARKLTAAFPPDVSLTDGYVVQIVAVSPTNGAAVSGVRVSNLEILATLAVPESAADDDTVAAPLPTFAPIPTPFEDSEAA